MRDLILPKKKELHFDLLRLDAVDKMSIQDVTSELVDLLGATLTAAIGDVTETRLVRSWMEKGTASRPDSLRTALKAARAIADQDSAVVAKAWFTGTNRFLEHRSPLEVLRENTAEGRTAIVRAAVSFAIG